jgi:hypothetical protein
VAVVYYGGSLVFSRRRTWLDSCLRAACTEAKMLAGKKTFVQKWRGKTRLLLETEAVEG